MFADACQIVHESVYAILGTTPLPPNQVNTGTGTGFMIADQILVTAAHVCHRNGNRSQPLHNRVEVCRSDDLGTLPLEAAEVLAEHPYKDIALLRIPNARSNVSVSLRADMVPTGRSVGSLGFPLATVTGVAGGLQLNAFERFQGAHISALRAMIIDGNATNFYETDALMYGGSSGCPGFLPDGGVVGMQVMTLNENAINPGVPPPPNPSPVSISFWVLAEDIAEFARSHGIPI